VTRDTDMTELELFVEQAMPHEAGHILVGRILGIPVNGLDHIVELGASNELVAGNFATKAFAPPNPHDFQRAPAQVRDAYVQMVAGGLAGNIVSKLVATEHGLAKDREDLRIVSANSLEEVAEESRRVIEAHIDVFNKLRMAIKGAYEYFVSGPRFALGRHTLLTAEELEDICPQNKALFPPYFFA
jgi:hypothetical protein